MPMLSRNLEKTLRRALALANARQHEYATLEHLLMALIDYDDATAVLKACAVEVDRLRTNLNDFLDHELTSLAVEGVVDAKPTAGFQRVIQRAAIHVQSAGRSEVTGATVRECLDAVEARYPGFRAQVLDDAGQVHRFVRLFVNGEPAGLDQPVEGPDSVEVLAAIAGG